MLEPHVSAPGLPLPTGVFESDKQNWPVIQGFARALSQLDGAPLAQCTRQSTAYSLPAVPACPAGYEGPFCSTDVNECVRGLAGCAQNATCTNTPSSYTCACYPGYSGDGRASCTANPAALAATTARYVTDGTGKLACSEGQDVAYPEGAPGFAYDPTGGLSRPGVGGQPAQVGGVCTLSGQEPAAHRMGTLEAMHGCSGATLASLQWNPSMPMHILCPCVSPLPCPAPAGPVWLEAAGGPAGVHAGLRRGALLHLVFVQPHTGSTSHLGTALVGQQFHL